MSPDTYREIVLSPWGDDSPVDRIKRNLLLLMDPPGHTRLRNLIAWAFNRRRIEAMAPQVEAISNRLLNRLFDSQDHDLIEHYAHPLPIGVVAQLLGIPAEDGARFTKWSREVVDFFAIGNPAPDVVRRTDDNFRALFDYFEHAVESRRASPRHDLISTLLKASEGDDRLSLDELVATCVLMLIAGHETTANLIANGVVALSTRDDVASRLRSNPDLIAPAIEEFLRFDSPVQATARTALEDIEVAGRTIPKGDQVVILIGSANRDPRVFSAPDEFRIDRRPNPHLSLGGGIHFCVGAPLARLEAKVAFHGLLRRLRSIRVACQPHEIEWMSAFPIRGPVRLPLDL